MKIEKVTINVIRDRDGNSKVELYYENTNKISEMVAHSDLKLLSSHYLAVFAKGIASILAGNEQMGIMDHQRFLNIINEEVLEILKLEKTFGVSKMPNITEHDN